MLTRIISLLFFAFAFTICNAQKDRTFFFKEVGWTITLPADFKIMDSADFELHLSDGKKLTEESNNVTIDLSETKTLINALKDGINYFNCTISPFSVDRDGSYRVSSQAARAIIYKTFADQMPDAKIDSSTTRIKVDGLSFDKFQVRVTLNESVLFNMVLLSRLHRNFDFGIGYLYLDEPAKIEMEHIISTSKLKK